MQDLGNVSGAWAITIAASCTLVALGYHTMTYTEENVERNEEVMRCIAWCYQIDKSMSLLLQRPPLLPKLSVSPVSLLSTHPTNAARSLFQLSIELSQAQEATLDLVSSPGRMERSKLLDGINSIHHDMVALHEKIIQVSGASSSSKMTKSLTSNSTGYIESITRKRQ